MRAAYAITWDRDALEAAARERTPDFPEHVRALLPESDEHLPRDVTDPERSPLDVKLTRLCELYRAGGPAERMFMLASVSHSIGSKLQGFGFRMAALAVRSGEVDLVRFGLIAHAIDDLASGDVRDTLCLLAPLADAARRIGADPVGLFSEVAAIAAPAMAAVLRDYVRNPAGIPSLGSMGFVAVEEAAGIRYRQGGFGLPKPHDS
jgi:hypothetical protein